MSKMSSQLWGGHFDLEVSFEETEEGAASAKQYETLGMLVSGWNAVEGSLEQLKQYCVRQNGSQIEPQPIENIFKYVTPRELYVPDNKETRCVILACDYEFDPEHGIGMLYKDGQLAFIGSQDEADLESLKK